jgi:hypothetical protein
MRERSSSDDVDDDDNVARVDVDRVVGVVGDDEVIVECV